MMKRFPLLIVLLNLVPVYGVLEWGWNTFDLVFLYWMENVIIGVLTVGRMLVHGYAHPRLAFALVIFVPFFIVHYGAFTWGHGTFVVSLFGKDIVPEPASGLVANVLPILEQQQLWWAVSALLALNAVDWVREIQTRGVGADNLRTLMTAPYRRIVVLHLGIIAGGFAVTAVNEPLGGLLALIVIKTGSDLYHWRQDEHKAQRKVARSALTPEKLRELEAKFPQPYVEVNGQRIEYDSFAQLKASSHFRTLQTLMSLAGASEELEAVTAYLDMRIEQENQATS